MFPASSAMRYLHLDDVCIIFVEYLNKDILHDYSTRIETGMS